MCTLPTSSDSRLSLALDTLTEHQTPKHLPLHLPVDSPKSKADTTKLLGKATSTAVECYTRETQVYHVYHQASPQFGTVLVSAPSVGERRVEWANSS